MDMINGTLTLPEGPNPLQVNINSIKNLEAAKPSAGVLGQKGLEESSDGAARFRFDLLGKKKDRPKAVFFKRAGFYF
jgi:hypothetical protein